MAVAWSKPLPTFGAGGAFTVEVAEVVVTPAFAPSSETVGRAAISESSSLADALEEKTGLRVAERGSGAVQADLSLRGSTFQQVLVAVDELPCVDPQTAHHNMDLPFPASLVERMEVIPSPASAFLGPGAFGGAVNVEPRRPTQGGSQWTLAGGSWDTWRAEGSLDAGWRDGAGAGAGSYTRSGGPRRGTDFTIWSVGGIWFQDLGRGGVNFLAGHTDKDFGARDFYAPYPSREKTSVSLVAAAAEAGFGGDRRLRFGARYRRHEDEFVLIETDPRFYRNRHVSEGVLERLSLVMPAGPRGTTMVGLERSDASLDSSNLGHRSEQVSSLFGRYQLRIGGVTAEAGARVDDWSGGEAEVSPAVSFSGPLGDAASWRCGLGRAVRLPSFTERYYQDPAHRGNARLEPEEAWNAEAGFEVRFAPRARFDLTGFRRDARDLIDWVRVSTNEPWVARNLGEAAFQGVETRLSGNVGPCGWEARYAYLDVGVEDTGLMSKYALNVARHDARLSVSWNSARGRSVSAGVAYRDVPTLDRCWLVHARASQRVGCAALFLQGRNLLDDRYEEIPGVPAPAAYLEIGVELKR